MRRKKIDVKMIRGKQCEEQEKRKIKTMIEAKEEKKGQRERR